MLHEFIEKLESIPATIIGGIFLVASFILEKLGITFIFDFAWITIYSIQNNLFCNYIII